MGRIGVLALVMVVTTMRAAQADVDLTGSWTLYFDQPPASQTWAFTQVGNSLGVVVNGGNFGGTINPATGEFTVLGPLTFCPVGLVATASPDGNAFSGSIIETVLYCPGPVISCTCIAGPVVSSVRACRIGAAGACCGNQVAEAGEECDHGPEPASACCDGTCHVRPAGTACTLDGSPCTGDVCDAAGLCTHLPLPDGTSCYDDLNVCTVDTCLAGACAHEPAGAGLPCPDDADVCTLDVCDAAGGCAHPPAADADGDGICDVRDECPDGVPLASAFTRVGRFGTPAGDDRLAIRGDLALPAPITPSIDPVAGGVRVLVRDATGGLVLDVAVPPGAYSPATGTGWRQKDAQTFVFRSPVPVGDAVRSVRLKLPVRTPGTVRVAVTGSNGSFAGAGVTPPLRTTVVLDPPADTAGQCGEVAFAAAACVFRSDGTMLVCR